MSENKLELEFELKLFYSMLCLNLNYKRNAGEFILPPVSGKPQIIHVFK